MAGYAIDNAGNMTIDGVFVAAGDIHSPSSIYVRDAGGTFGYVQINLGDTTHSGYAGFYNHTGGREGYIGFATTTGGSDGGTIPMVCGTFAIAGAITVSGTATINGVILKNPQTSRVAATGTFSTVETYVTPAFQIAANTLAVGDTFEIVIAGTCISSTTNVVTFSTRLGGAGTTSDTAILAFGTVGGTVSGSGVPWELRVRFTVRTIGSSGTAIASASLITITSNQGVNQNGQTAQLGAQVTINTTGALFLGESIVTAGVGTTIIVQQATVHRVT